MANKIMTVPNALTMVRALGVPLFAYAALGPHADAVAILILIIAGATDYFDGKIARAWNQQSRLGELLDPAVDRIYIATTLIVLYLRHAIPIWLILVLLSRDLILGALTLALKRVHYAPMTVTYLGKAATFNLLYSFPLLLLAQSHLILGSVAFVLGWSFAVWGSALYLVTGFDYFRIGWRLLATAK
jgi:cardiolipin synthase